MVPVMPPPFAVEAHRVAVAVQEHDARDDKDPQEHAHYDADGGVCARGRVSPPQFSPSCEVGRAQRDMWDRVRRRGGPRGGRWGGRNERAGRVRDIHPMLGVGYLIVYSGSLLKGWDAREVMSSGDANDMSNKW